MNKLFTSSESVFILFLVFFVNIKTSVVCSYSKIYNRGLFVRQYSITLFFSAQMEEGVDENVMHQMRCVKTV